MVIGTTTESHVETFSKHRPLLFGIAWRMLGNPTDADDILQEGFLRWLRTSPLEVRSPRAFLVTVITRLCLNHLDLARVKKEIPFDTDAPLATLETIPSAEFDPAHDADLADALDAAFSVVLKCLSPVERAVFLLREVFECDYAEVSRIVEKSEDNCRQIVSRARERVAGRDPRFEVSVAEQESLLREFLNATASGDLERLARTLAGDATLARDGDNLGAAAPNSIHGAAEVAEFLVGKMKALLSPGTTLRRSRFREVPLLLAYRGGMLVNALALVPRAGRVQTVYLINCPVRLRSIAAQNLTAGNEEGGAL
jgi:RNA polymerase sigma-70 factor (ECF subfamily)